MAGGKLPPRQKMIGMMYLVLTCLLAMNVSKDVLNAFVVFNESLQRTNEKFKWQSDRTYSDFQAAFDKDPAKTKPFLDKANDIKKKTQELVDYIVTLKKKTIANTIDDPTGSIADTIRLQFIDSKDNYDKPTNFLIGSELTTPKNDEFSALALKNKLDEYRKAVLSHFEDKALFKAGILEEMNSKIDFKTDMKAVENDVPIGWEGINFYHLPLAAVVANFTNIEAQVRNAEADAVAELLKAVKGKDFTFDKLAAKVIAPSSYIQSGDEYTADVLLTAFNSTSNPTILLGEYDSINKKMITVRDSLPVEGGFGKYKIRTGAEGEQTWKGAIKVEKPDGTGFDYYPFEQKYMVAKPSLVVSPDKMNVIYKGVPNPITISVPGVASEKLVPRLVGASGTINATNVKEGKYEISISDAVAKTVTVEVGIKDGNSTKSAGKGYEFRLKPIPDPVPKFAGKEPTDGTATLADLKGAVGVIADMKNFDFDLKFQVLGFDLVSTVNGFERVEKSTSNKVTTGQSNLLNSLKKGNRITIENIKAKGPDGRERTLNSITLKAL
jgi:gliding motility-associated protein GldM